MFLIAALVVGFLVGYGGVNKGAKFHYHINKEELGDRKRFKILVDTPTRKTIEVKGGSNAGVYRVDVCGGCDGSVPGND
jgi:hypothetical protein